jgi:8-oxo-dGTP pyrophosphatase MutT (NUDIX family)
MVMNNLERFNVRVYGILVNEGNVLISHERFMGRTFTKFPGGGLELGEGVVECIVREFKEEMNIDIIPSYLFHATESLQISSFYPEDQVVALYYIVLCDDPAAIITSKNKEDIAENEEAFEWVLLTDFKKEMLTFESDREAAGKLFDKQKL